MLAEPRRYSVGCAVISKAPLARQQHRFSPIKLIERICIVNTPAISLYDLSLITKYKTARGERAHKVSEVFESLQSLQRDRSNNACECIISDYQKCQYARNTISDYPK